MRDERILSELLREAALQLHSVTDVPQLEAKLLYGHVSGLSVTECVSKSKDVVPAQFERTFQELLERRRKHEPLAYLTGEREFYGYTFSVSPDVLIPRPETELLVERAIVFLKKRHQAAPNDELKILDLGTGSGCIALTLAKELAKLGIPYTIDGIDRSEQALSVARMNSEKLEAANVSFFRSSWFSNMSGALYDLIVSNPPYISEDDPSTGTEIAYEPTRALFAGETGLDALRVIVTQVQRYLRDEGSLIVEIGSNQGDQVQELIEGTQPWKKVSIVQDLAGLDRCVEMVSE